MYNVELKKIFLSTLQSETDKYETTFNRFEELEERLNTDLCQMDRTWIIDNVFEKGFVEPPTLANYLACINEYRSWCVLNAIDGAIQSKELNVRSDIDFIPLIPQELYFSFNDMYDELRNSGYDFCVGDEAAPALVLGWLGLKMSEIVALREDQVDLETGQIQSTDRSGSYIDINDALMLDILRKYKSTLKTERDYNGRDAYMKTTGYFIHKIGRRNEDKSGPANRQQINRKIRDAKKAHQDRYPLRPCRLSMQSAFRSGSLFRLRLLEMSGVDFTSKKNQKLIQKTYGSAGGQLQYVLFYYEQYKKAFNLL